MVWCTACLSKEWVDGISRIKRGRIGKSEVSIIAINAVVFSSPIITYLAPRIHMITSPNLIHNLDDFSLPLLN